jgi:L-lactate dehydrogenase complex protein LldG
MPSFFFSPVRWAVSSTQLPMERMLHFVCASPLNDSRSLMATNEPPSLADLFLTNARDAAATVERVVASPAAVFEALERATKGARSIVVATGEWLPPEILSVALDLPNVIASPSDEQLARADVGITEAFAGVASSGSICVVLGAPLTAAASLLMPLHIVLLSARRIVAQPRDLFDGECLGGEGLQRNLVFITGPSATADMGPLVRGVHGPHRLHILLLE